MGTISYALGINCFTAPHHIAPGGACSSLLSASNTRATSYYISDKIAKASETIFRKKVLIGGLNILVSMRFGKQVVSLVTKPKIH